MNHRITMGHLGAGTILMLGAKNFVNGTSTFQFDIGRGAKGGATRVVIELSSDDYYEITTYKWRKLNLDVVAKKTDIFVENLRTTLCTMLGV
jgi:hypothetical protein